MDSRVNRTKPAPISLSVEVESPRPVSEPVVGQRPAPVDQFEARPEPAARVPARPPLRVSREHLRALGDRVGGGGAQRLERWGELLGGGGSEPEKLAAVNAFFNEVPFAPDAIQWEQKDYWATPVEMLAAQAGDCEDFAIGKYLSLRAMGVPAERLRITYVRASLPDRTEAHMVLTYSPPGGGEPLVLDNLTPDILPASRRGDLSSVFAFNEQTLWLAPRLEGPWQQTGSPTQIARWQALLARVRVEMGEAPPER